MLTNKEKPLFLLLLLMGWWPSSLKRLFYRLCGYKIAQGVHFGFGSLLIAKSAEIGKGTKFGLLATIQAKSVKIGPLVNIGRLSNINTYDVEIGEGTIIGNNVRVGGMQTPESRFKIGYNCILMEHSFVNTTKPVLIGNEVGIGGHCLIFTHGLWPNTFQGYPARFGQVCIEDDAWLAWRVSILPDVTVGRGAILSTDSCVTKSIPAMAFAAGTPAKVIKENGTFLSKTDGNSKVTILRKVIIEFCEWCEFNNVLPKEENADIIHFYNGKNEMVGLLSVRYNRDAPFEQENIYCSKGAAFLSLCDISKEEKELLSDRGVSWLNLFDRTASVEQTLVGSEVEQFFRKSGVRFLKYRSR